MVGQKVYGIPCDSTVIFECAADCVALVMPLVYFYDSTGAQIYFDEYRKKQLYNTNSMAFLFPSNLYKGQTLYFKHD